MKTMLFLLLLLHLCCFSTMAQTTGPRTYDLTDLELRVGAFLGKAGNHYMLIDRVPDAGKGVPLFILDSNKQFEKKIYLPQHSLTAQKFIVGNSIRFINFLPEHQSRMLFDSVSIFIMQVDENGQLRNIGGIHSNTSAAVYPTIITDKTSGRQLICNFHSLDSSNILFTGVLLDKSGKSVKNLAYQVDFDLDFSQQPRVMLDSKGNIHVIVAERLSSHHLSSAVTIHTIPFQEEELSSETFQFEKVKFNRFVLSDNPAKQAIQLQGFYYDGQLKNTKKGLVSLQLPYERGRPPVSQFNLFPDQLREQLRKKLTHLRNKDDVMNSIALNNVVTENGTTLLSFWVRDITEFDLPSDYQTDLNREKTWLATVEHNMSNRARRRNESKNTMEAFFFQQAIDSWLNFGARAGISTSYNPVDISNAFFSNYSYDQWSMLGNQFSSIERSRTPGAIPLSRIIRKMNLVNFRLNTDGVADYSVIGSGFLYTGAGERLEATQYPLLFDNSLYFALNEPANSEHAFTLLQPQFMNEPTLQPSSLVLPAYSILSAPVRTGSDTYMWLVKNDQTLVYSLLEYSPK